MDREAFVSKVAELVRKYAPQYGIKVYSPIIAQACKESAFGASELAVNANNFFGLKYKTGRCPGALPDAYEKVGCEQYADGTYISSSMLWFKFASMEDCVKGYFDFINTNRYANLKGVTDPLIYCQLLYEDGYATSLTYSSSLFNDYIQKYELTLYDDREAKPMKNIKIMLDAGHDGRRNQSPVIPQYYESDMVWKLQNYLKEYLEALGIFVATTRASQNEVMDVVVRGKKSKGYDLFLSLHSNACGTESVDRPVGIFLADDAKTDIDEKSKALAVNLANRVRTLMQTTQNAQTYSKLAGYDRNGNGITTDDDYYGVLYGAHIVGTPGIILEHSFHTNRRAALWLSDNNNLKLLAREEALVIATFFGMDGKIQINNKEVVDTVVYTVKKGDTLGAIAKAYGTTVDEIVALNPIIRNKNLISVGWKLTMPTTASQGTAIATEKAVEYIVKKGDNLTKIAKKYGTTVVKLVALNGIANASKIYPGQVIRLQ